MSPDNNALALVLLMLSLLFPWTHSVHAASSMGGLPVSNPAVHNLAGEEMDTIEIGQQAIIEVTVSNNVNEERPFVILIEVRDGHGVTMALFWQSGLLEADGNYTMGASWRPEVPCSSFSEGCNNNQIRVFVVSDLENPQVLSEIREMAVTVTGTPPLANTIYTFVHDETSYQIPYSLDSGRIHSVAIDKELILLSITLENVPKDSTLVIEVPRSLVVEVFSCGNQPLYGYELLTFVDGVEDEVLTMFGGEFETWDFELEAGSRNIEIVGACTT